MFRKHNSRRSNPLFIAFRLILSLSMFLALLAGLYSAYKHFSGLDPLKLDPKAILTEVLAGKIPQQLITVLSSNKLTQDISNQINQKTSSQSKKISTRENLQYENQAVSSKPLFKFLALADSHNDNINLKKAITYAKEKYPDLAFIIGLGDYTDVGTIDELKKAKVELDSSGLRYFVVPGDHDFWDSRNRGLPPNSNFREVFGPSYQSFTFEDFRLILLNNSDNYLGMDEEQLRWLQIELEKGQESKGIYVFLHEPLYHPSSDHFMGRVTGELKQQAKSLIYQLKEAGVKKVFSGDIHYFSEYEEGETKLSMVTIGAVTTERNPQTPRFAVVWVFENGEIKVEDVEIK